MRFSILCLCLFVLATNVLANDYAGPYQMMLLWYAYRMEIKMYGVGETYLANLCEGHAPDGSCLFDEFLKYIQRGPGRNENWVKWTGDTTVGTNLNPDVEATARELLAMKQSPVPSQRYEYKENWYRLYRREFSPRAVPYFSEAYTKVINLIQDMRKAAPTLDPPVDVSDELHSIRQSIVSVLAGRQHDSANWLIRGVNDIIQRRGLPWTVATKLIKGMDGTSWRTVDFGQTLEDHPEVSDQLKANIAEFVTDFGSLESTDDLSHRHYNAVQASRIYQDVLLSDNTCHVRTPQQ